MCRYFLVCRTPSDAPYDLQLLRRQLVEIAGITLPRRLPGRTQLESRAFLPRGGSEALKGIERASQLDTGLRATLQPSQLLTIEKAGPSLFESPVAVRMMRESFLVRGQGRLNVVCNERPTASQQRQRPRRDDPSTEASVGLDDLMR